MLVLPLLLTLVTGVTYRPPVDAPVVDAFRPPACTWCPGNRGIDYATAPGTPVRAAGEGVVTFAGTIAGDRYVTVAHPDGLRTSYAYLAGVTVRAGDRVARGQVLGTTGSSLHFGLRRGATYLDPMLLFATTRPVARLVPLDGHHRGGWGARRRAARLLRRPASRRAATPKHRTQPARGRPSGRGPGAPTELREKERTRHGAGRHHAAAARGGRALRAPDPPLEPQDEALHLR